MKKVRKAVIAAAGFGTRFLPQTKAMPKEMLPIVDKPIIQYIVEELVDAGVEDIIIVTGYHKRAIEDHFDQISADLRENLVQGKKLDRLQKVENISSMANFVYIRQKGRYGNATPVLNASHLIGDEPFIYTFADDFIAAKPSRFKQMIQTYERTEASILPCIRLTEDEQYSRYGIVAGEVNDKDSSLLQLSTIVEKPGKEHAPSDLASVSGYLFTPDILQYLKQADDTFLGDEEFMIQPVMQSMINDSHLFYAKEITAGTYYDTGNKLEYIKTVVDYALKDKSIAEDFKVFLHKIVK